MFEDVSSYRYYYLLPGLLVLATPLLLRLRSSSTSKDIMAQPSTSAAAPKHTFVVLGAGYAGIPMAHHLLKHTPAGVVNLRVVLVAPYDALYWNGAAPRGFLPTNDADTNPKGTPGYGDDKLFFPLAPTLPSTRPASSSSSAVPPASTPTARPSTWRCWPVRTSRRPSGTKPS